MLRWMNVIPFKIPAAKRAANKLARVQSSAPFVAAVDALLDIRPRRTSPEAMDIVISPEGYVFVVDVNDEPAHLGSVDELVKNLHGLAAVAELEDDERAALLRAVEEAKVDEPFDESGA